MKPDQIEPAAARIGKMTRIYLTGILDPALEQAKRRRDELKAEVTRRSAPPPAVPMVGSTAYWPIPMDWTKVRGRIRGTYVVECSYKGDPLPPLKGPFELDFRGDGSILGTYESDRVQWPVNGKIDSRGEATGGGAGEAAHYSWVASFDRSGDNIVMTKHTLRVVPDDSDTSCKPGYMRQQ